MKETQKWTASAAIIVGGVSAVVLISAYAPLVLLAIPVGFSMFFMIDAIKKSFFD